jgi:hypothetical protein
VIQFTLKNGKLFLITPGAPLQEMEATGKNGFRSKTIKDGSFLFVQNKTATELISTNSQGIIKGKKISGKIEDYSEVMDSLLTLKKTSTHFEFWFSEIDQNNVDSLIKYLEKNYYKILSDLKSNNLPTTRVKIYPELKDFHLSINSAGAPPEVRATAFGKTEIRMVSPNKWGDEKETLMQQIAHEFVHCVHLTIDYSPNNPRWLWEGVAMYESGWFIDPNELDIITTKKFPSLNQLGNGMEYMLGYVIVEAINDRWGFDTIINLIKTQGNSQKVLHINQEEFEEKIFDRIYQKYVTDKNK